MYNATLLIVFSQDLASRYPCKKNKPTRLMRQDDPRVFESCVCILFFFLILEHFLRDHNYRVMMKNTYKLNCLIFIQYPHSGKEIYIKRQTNKALTHLKNITQFSSDGPAGAALKWTTCPHRAE